MLYHTGVRLLWSKSFIVNLISGITRNDPHVPVAVSAQILAGLHHATLNAMMGGMFGFMMRVPLRVIVRFTLCWTFGWAFGWVMRVTVQATFGRAIEFLVELLLQSVSSILLRIPMASAIGGESRFRNSLQPVNLEVSSLSVHCLPCLSAVRHRIQGPIHHLTTSEMRLS